MFDPVSWFLEILEGPVSWNDVLVGLISIDPPF